MIRSLVTSVCALLIFSTATAQFTCSLHSANQNTCDAAKAEDGSGCVWCSWSSYGLCVAEGQAAQMKKVLPSLTCDDDSNGGDDDSTTSDDDNIPDDSVFACLKNDNTGDCGKASCVWCDTKGGFGVCLTEEAAEGFAKDSYWFDCNSDDANSNTNEVGEKKEGNVEDPLDTACLLAGIASNNDESACVAATDSDGGACEFCSVSGIGFCLNSDQAQIASLVGGSCDSDNASANAGAGASMMSLEDPYDTTCLMAQISSGGNDESACVGATDADGYGCEWCSLSNGLDFCLTSEQASIAEVVGGTCEDSGEPQVPTKEGKERNVQDPTDTACILAGLAGGNDKSACVAAVDADGDACEFCSIGNGLSFCLNSDQAQIASLVGGTCESSNLSAGADEALVAETKEENSVQDPLDTACLLAGIASNNDESACVAATDSDGGACEFCSVSGIGFCLNSDQAQIASLVGGSCDSDDASANAGAGASMMSLEDPYDTTCLMAQISSGGNDESACVGATDADGYGCEWCSLSNGLDFCLTSEQASIAEVVGGTCEDSGEPQVPTKEGKERNVQDPTDTACILAGLAGGNDKSACVAAVDADGDACEFCSIGNGLSFCLNSDQAQIASLVGGTCESNDVLSDMNAATAYKKSLRN